MVSPDDYYLPILAANGDGLFLECLAHAQSKSEILKRDEALSCGESRGEVTPS